MNMITIENENIKVDFAPEFGGMICKINCKGNDVLLIDTEMLGKENVLAGGIPILFPFCAMLEDNKYKVNGKEYEMLFHGFVRDMALELKTKTDTMAELILEPNEITRKQYPFDFGFMVKYEVVGSSLKISAEVKNNSKEDMPFYMGWHPYFKASDRSAFKVDIEAENYIDFINGTEGVFEGELNLRNEFDHVFYPIKDNKYSIRNEADKYELDVVMDKHYYVAVIYTGKKGAVCVQPWTGLPNAINTNKSVIWVKENEIETCSFEMKIKAI